MEKDAKVKQIVVRIDKSSYDSICKYARIEHRGLGEFVRHAVLHYIESAENSASPAMCRE